MKQARLTQSQIEDLQKRGYTFTARHYYWTVWEGTNIVNRITKREFLTRSITEPFQSIEQVRIYERG